MTTMTKRTQTKRAQLKGLPVRVQFTLNPILHRDAIVLLQNLSKNEQANDRSPIEPMSRPTPTRPDEIYSS